jgi:lipid A ethanolaminephosphotransferase
VDWLDNQAGCKGVCNRISNAQADKIASAAALSQWCKDDECLDQIMVELLDQRLKRSRLRANPRARCWCCTRWAAMARPTTAVRPQPTSACRSATHVTSDCSRGQLVNVYDNSIVETDHFVSRTIDWLQTQQDRFETGLIYLSDHGESLGENGLYLHGLPYVIAPDVQKHVPWVLWPGTLLARTQVAERCLRAGTDAALTHDHFYHSVLGLLDVRSSTYRPS